MIKPTPGRGVWFHANEQQAVNWRLNGEQPCGAEIAYVHSDTMVNLRVTSHDGQSRGVTSVRLVQVDENDNPINPAMPGEMWCEWMPYQKGQASKTEQLEKFVASRPIAAHNIVPTL